MQQSQRSPEENCNRQNPANLAESLYSYGLHAFHLLPRNHGCNKKNKPFILRKFCRPPIAIGLDGSKRA